MCAGNLLAQPDGVHIRRIEKVNARVQRNFEVFARVLFVNVPAFGALRPRRQIAAAVAHAAQAQSGYGDSRLA